MPVSRRSTSRLRFWASRASTPTLPTDAAHIALYNRVVQLVRVPDDGRFVLRIGGNSSDHAFWDPDRRPLPHWAFEVTPAWVTSTARIVRRLRLRVIIDLNTVTSTPRLAADWADAAEDRLPRGSIIGFEIGNEPDVYERNFWLYRLGGTTFDAGLLPNAITARSYATDYDAYARALATAAPKVPLLGPALSNPRTDVGWISTLLSHPHPRLGEITVHKYPYTACARLGGPAFPTVAKLLSNAASAGAAQTIRPAVAIGRLAGYEVRLTELNSVGCGGVAGVSNTFATALWAADTLFELARAGVAGVELHVRLYSINAPFRFYGDGVLARPLLYGLILFRRMLGPDSRLVPVAVSSRTSLHLKAWAVRVSRDTLNVLLIDKGTRSIAVRLRLPSTGAGQVQRLSAPSAAAQTAVTLAGQHLSRAVTWLGRPMRADDRAPRRRLPGPGAAPERGDADRASGSRHAGRLGQRPGGSDLASAQASRHRPATISQHAIGPSGQASRHRLATITQHTAPERPGEPSQPGHDRPTHDRAADAAPAPEVLDR